MRKLHLPHSTYKRRRTILEDHHAAQTKALLVPVVGKAKYPGIGGEDGGENKKALTVNNRKGLILMVRPKRFELLTYRFVACI